MASKSRQSLPAKIMAAIGDALTPPISDESGETPNAAEVRKSAIRGAGVGKIPAAKRSQKPGPGAKSAKKTA